MFERGQKLFKNGLHKWTSPLGKHGKVNSSSDYSLLILKILNSKNWSKTTFPANDPNPTIQYNKFSSEEFKNS